MREGEGGWQASLFNREGDAKSIMAFLCPWGRPGGPPAVGVWGSARGKRTCTTMQLLLVLLASWRVVGDTLLSVDGRAALRELQPAGSIDLRIRASAARAGDS